MGHLALRADGIGPASPCDEITSSGVIPNLHVTAGEAETEIQALYAAHRAPARDGADSDRLSLRLATLRRR
ncbi:MAG: hypothetical protein R2856_24435 [Caldilineaceae bacterium]